LFPLCPHQAKKSEFSPEALAKACVRTIAHLSDPHFGRLQPTTVEALVSCVVGVKPDLVVVSGDLTQRAKHAEFEEARRFLDALPSPQIVVPGNHDVPLYNIFARTLKPLSKYQRYIDDDLEPFYSDDEIAVLGINTARSFTFQNGRVDRKQVERSSARLGACAKNITRIIVTHHPFDFPQTHKGKDLVGRARMAMESFARCGVDLILSGHLHISHTGESVTRYKIPGHSALLIQAGTATSSRGRGELNSFNIIHIDGPCLSIKRMTWNNRCASFVVSHVEHFEKTARSWSRTAKKNMASKQ
jgi:3',5'-cyclic AMP phosphodiesterase CpdA